jgi:hypothetical protein
MGPGPVAPGRAPMARLRLGCWIMLMSTDLLTPTAAETKLIRAAAELAEAELCGDRNGQQPVIRAEVLRALCTSARPQWPVKNRIRMAGGRVRGHLDLSGAHLAHALHFIRCVFEDRVDLTRARADKPVEWDGGQVDSVLADHFSSQTDLVIRNVTATGLICLQSAWVRGDVRLSGSRMSPRGGQAICGDHLRVGGALFLDGEDFHARAKSACVRRGSKTSSTAGTPASATRRATASTPTTSLLAGTSCWKRAFVPTARSACSGPGLAGYGRPAATSPAPPPMRCTQMRCARPAACTWTGAFTPPPRRGWSARALPASVQAAEDGFGVLIADAGGLATHRIRPYPRHSCRPGPRIFPCHGDHAIFAGTGLTSASADSRSPRVDSHPGSRDRPAARH